MSKVDEALSFATVAHEGQKRKYTGEDYVTHCIEVAKIIATVGHDENMLCAALLHDTVEDTSTTIEDIFIKFGEDVAELVSGLTDVSKKEDGNRKVRKTIDREHSAKQSARCQTIKLADLISNTSSILAHDKEFAKVYFAEKRELLAVLTKGNKQLWEQANRIVEDYYAH